MLLGPPPLSSMRRSPLLVALLAGVILSCSDLTTGPEAEPCPGPSSGEVCLHLAAQGLRFTMDADRAPGQDWMVIGEQSGVLHVFDGNSLRAEPFLDLSDRAKRGDEQGFLGLAFDPGFPSQGFVYVHYTNLDGDNQISRFETTPDGRTADPGSEVRLLTIPTLGTGLHNGGPIAFDPSGQLWVATGDGFDSATAQDRTSLRGSILRIDPSRPEAVPDDNPYVGRTDVRPEIWMYGVRNPYGLHIDPVDGRAYIADVGHERREELNVVPWRTPGLNFGWARLEGSLCMRDGCEPDGTVLPTYEYGHDRGCAILGGVVYRGRAFPELVGHYVYADFCGAVRSLKVVGGAVTDEREWLDNEVGPLLRLVAGPDDELYLMTVDQGIYRLDPHPAR